MPSPRILVLFNEPVLPTDHRDAESEREVVLVSEVVAKILATASFEVSRLGISYNLTPLVSELQLRPPDVIFNLFEGLGGKSHTEACIASLLEWHGIPCTGSPAQALHLARNKPLTKILLQGAALPTPEFELVERLPLDSRPRNWPVIVKPALEDASIGIDQASVVQEKAQLAERVANVLENYGAPVLVEGYVPGREFNISVIESSGKLQVMPLCEIQFDRRDEYRWPIVTYDAKWRPETTDYAATPPHFTRDLAPQLAAEIRDLAMRTFRLLGCRDYARVDFRVNPASKPYIIEVNPNPCISPEAGLSAAVRAGGLTHAEFIVQVARAALGRSRIAAKERIA